MAATTSTPPPVHLPGVFLHPWTYRLHYTKTRLLCVPLWMGMAAEMESSPPQQAEEEEAKAAEEQEPAPQQRAEEGETKAATVQEAAPAEITLRPFDLSDVDDFMVWASDERVSSFCSWDVFTSRDELLRYMAEVVLPHPWFRAVCVGGRPVGTVSVSLNSGNDRCRGEIGYVLASRYWGRGLATRAVRAAVSAVFREVPGLERVEALVDVGNPASQRVMEKAGFLREGVLRRYWTMKGRTRDMVMYSILSTDPPSPP